MTIKEGELRELLKEAAKAGIEEYRKEEAKKRRKTKYHDTFKLMKCYRDAVFHIENAISEGEQVEDPSDLPIEDAEQQEVYLRSIRRTRFRTMLMTAHIDKALDEVESRRRQQGREIEYSAFDLYFMQGATYEQIAEELETGKNTPSRWVRGIINELSVLLWGLDE